ncbi:hypothetical protein EON62_04335 [archaeon]|nr:MAG: hypothetical protein EON62_04335 [archaeon]
MRGAAALSPPGWGSTPLYSVRVNMTNPQPVATWQFDYYFDAARFNVTGSKFKHYPPQYDEMCMDPTFPGSSFECDVTFAVDGWSYIAFPAANPCCKCENQFGSVLYNWLAVDSTFQGVVPINNVKCEHWTKQGQYLNHYYCEVGSREPVRFNELWGPNAVLKQWDFLAPTYNTTAFDASIVQPPPGCQTLCTSAVCQAYRS